MLGLVIDCAFKNLVAVEKRELLCEIVIETVVEQVLHGLRVEGEHGHDVATVKLQETVVEELWNWLVVDDVNNLADSLANVETFEYQQMSQCWNSNVDVINRLIELKGCLPSIFIILLLADCNLFVLQALTPKVQIIARIDLEKVVPAKRMDDTFFAFIIDEKPLFMITKCKHFHTC